MEQYFEKEPVIIKEKKKHSTGLWYTIVIILVLVLVGWYGYSTKWFSQRQIIDEGGLPLIDTTTLFENVTEIPIDSIIIEASGGFPVEQIVVIRGNLPNGCAQLNTPAQIREGNVFYVTMSMRSEGDICTEALVPYEEQIPLQTYNLPAGVYIVNINGRELSFELENNNHLDFNAGENK